MCLTHVWNLDSGRKLRTILHRPYLSSPTSAWGRMVSSRPGEVGGSVPAGRVFCLDFFSWMGKWKMWRVKDEDERIAPDTDVCNHSPSLLHHLHPSPCTLHLCPSSFPSPNILGAKKKLSLWRRTMILSILVLADDFWLNVCNPLGSLRVVPRNQSIAIR